jgi:hypothetical protein
LMLGGDHWPGHNEPPKTETPLPKIPECQANTFSNNPPMPRERAKQPGTKPAATSVHDPVSSEAPSCATRGLSATSVPVDIPIPAPASKPAVPEVRAEAPLLTPTDAPNNASGATAVPRASAQAEDVQMGGAQAPAGDCPSQSAAPINAPEPPIPVQEVCEEVITERVPEELPDGAVPTQIRGVRMS